MEDKQKIDSIASDVEFALSKQQDVSSLKNMSAEINTLLSFYDDCQSSAYSDCHLLLHTDTYMGWKAAVLVEKFLRTQGFEQVNLYLCEKLTTRSTAEFRFACTTIAEHFSKILPGWKEQHYNIIFQLSGGFKSFQGFMQVVGMFFADEVIYKFEGADELIRIPRIPIKLDDTAIGIVKNNLAACRNLVRKEILTPSEAEGLLSLELFVEQENDMVAITPWGTLCWELAKKELYNKELLDPHHEKIRYGQDFMKSAKNECTSAKRWEMLNERIDDLASFINSNQKVNLRRLDVKKLQGNPMPPSTHECDAWAESPAHRIFLHREGEVWILDKLAPGLH